MSRAEQGRLPRFSAPVVVVMSAVGTIGMVAVASTVSVHLPIPRTLHFPAGSPAPVAGPARLGPAGTLSAATSPGLDIPAPSGGSSTPVAVPAAHVTGAGTAGAGRSTLPAAAQPVSQVTGLLSPLVTYSSTVNALSTPPGNRASPQGVAAAGPAVAPTTTATTIAPPATGAASPFSTTPTPTAARTPTTTAPWGAGGSSAGSRDRHQGQGGTHGYGAGTSGRSKGSRSGSPQPGKPEGDSGSAASAPTTVAPDYPVVSDQAYWQLRGPFGGWPEDPNRPQGG